MPTRSYRCLLLTLAVLGCGLDLASKYEVFRWLSHDGRPARQGSFEAWTNTTTWRGGREIALHGGRDNLVPGWLGLTAEYNSAAKASDNSTLNSLQTWSAPILPHVNHGALFGLGGDHEHRANLAFAVVSLLAALAILGWGLQRANATDRWLCIALGLILGGTLGNLFDRIVFGGVRDFLYFYKIEWPVFNVADCGLVVGAGMLLLQALFVKKKVTATIPLKSLPAAAP